MKRKNAISILLALSLVFSVNTISFAEEVSTNELGEETVTENSESYEDEEQESEEDASTENAEEESTESTAEAEETTADESADEEINSDEVVEIESQVSVSSDSVSKNKSGSENKVSSNGFNGKADLTVEYNSAATYTGRKIKASDLDITVSVDNYIVDAKSIKITGEKKNTSTGNTFKIKSIDTDYKNIKFAARTKIDNTYYDAGTNVYDSRSSEDAGEMAAKAALKAVKKDFNTYLKKSENNLFGFDIDAVYIDDYVTYKELKSLKVSGNSYAFNTYDKNLKNTAVVKINSSGKIKGVYILAKGSERTNGTYTVRKVKLKKNTDYTITDSVITFDGTNINYSTGYDLTKIGAASGQNT